MNQQEKLEIIEKHWYKEAIVYKEAGETLRTVNDQSTMEERAVAVGNRLLSLQRSDALIDAWLDIKNGEQI